MASKITKTKKYLGKIYTLFIRGISKANASMMKRNNPNYHHRIVKYNPKQERLKAQGGTGLVLGRVPRSVSMYAVYRRKKQGYNARMDESLGMRRGKAKSKKQSYKSRRDESKGMSKASGRRAYASVRSMDKSRRKKK